MEVSRVNWFTATILFYILAAILYLLFLVLFRHDLRPSALLFLFPTISMVVAISYQIFKQEAHPGSEKIILLEIALFALLLHLFRVIPLMAGVFGDDFPIYFYSTKLVMNHGFPIPENILAQYGSISGGIKGVSNYPILIMNGGLAWKITGVDPIVMTRWLPSIWSTIGILALYILTKSMFNDKRAALLAALAFSTIPYHAIGNHTQYIKTTIAFVMLLFAIYAFYSTYQRNRRNLSILGIIFTGAVVLAHYYVSAVWIALLLIFALCSMFIEYLVRQRELFPSISVRPSQNAFWVFIALAISMAFSHWLYMETTVLPTLSGLGKEVARQGTTSAPFGPIGVSTLKEEILAHVNRFVRLGFYVTLLFEVIRGIRGSCRYLKEDFFIASCVALFLVVLPYALLFGGPQLHTERVTIFGNLFMVIGVAHAGSSMKKGAGMNNRKIGNVIMALIIVFIIMNLFQSPAVPANPIDSSEREIIRDNEIVYTFSHFPQDPQGIAAMGFYQDAESATFARWFEVGDREVFTQADEETVRHQLYGFKPYTKSYNITSPDLYQGKEMIYNNGKVMIYK